MVWKPISSSVLGTSVAGAPARGTRSATKASATILCLAVPLSKRSTARFSGSDDRRSSLSSSVLGLLRASCRAPSTDDVITNSKRTSKRRGPASSAMMAASVARQDGCDSKTLRSLAYAEREEVEEPPAAPERSGLAPKNSSTRANLSSTVATARCGAVRLRAASLRAPSKAKSEDTSEMLLRLGRPAARHRRPR